MILNYFLTWTRYSPGEVNPILVVDTNAKLTFASTSELFQTVTRWDTQITEYIKTGAAG